MRRLTWLCSVIMLAGVGAYAQTGGDYFVYAGSYTNPTPTTTSAAKGIYGFRFDSKAGTLSPLGLVAETINPAHVWAHPNGKFLYASNWETGVPGDYLTAYSIDQPYRQAHTHQQGRRERRSSEPGCSRSERQIRGDGHLQQRYVFAVRCGA